jgi:hypothetical protein
MLSKFSVLSGVVAALVFVWVLPVSAKTHHATSPLACMQGVDTAKTSISAEVYCGPASAVVQTPEIGKVTVKPGTCVKGIRGPGSWDLYLGKDKSGQGPWPLTLHISKPTATSKPGLLMEWRYTQWSAVNAITLTVGGKGGSFTGTAIVRRNGKNAKPVRQPIKGTFTC